MPHSRVPHISLFETWVSAAGTNVGRLTPFDLDPPFPVSRFAARVSDRQDLDVAAIPLPVNQNERKFPQQESASLVRTNCPALRSLRNLSKCTIKFCIELEGRVRAALKIPVKRRVIFGAGFFVKLRYSSGHEAASLNYAVGLPSRERFSPCPNRVL